MTTFNLQKHHRVALALIVPLIASIGVDSVFRGATGEPTFITDDTVGPPALGALVEGILGLAFFALFWVLRSEAARFDQLGRVARACRKILIVGTAVLGAGMILVGPVMKPFSIDSGPAYDLSGLVATAGLGLTVLAALVLGLTQVRANVLGLGGRLLTLLVPVGALTAAVAMVNRDLASPVFLTITILGGLALLGVGVPSLSGTKKNREQFASNY